MSATATKRGTTPEDVRRHQFETARKILFGTDIIPGTANRGRWTTAGVVSKQYLATHQNGQKFTLGPHEFTIAHGNYGRMVIKLHETHAFTLEESTIFVHFPKLSKQVYLNCTTIRVMDQTPLPGEGYAIHERKRNFFHHNGRVYYNVGFHGDVNTFFGRVNEYAPMHITPDNVPALTAYYDAHKNVTHVDIDFNMYVESRDYNLNLPDVKIPLLKLNWNEIPHDGVVQYPDKRMTCIFNRGLIGLQFCASGELDWSLVKPMFPTADASAAICEFDNGEFWFHSDLLVICDALAWLMHVLTGPDPRNYEAPLQPGRRPLLAANKESSEPRPQPWFTFTQDDGGMHHMTVSPSVITRRGGFELTFFQYVRQPDEDPDEPDVPEVAVAAVIRQSILNWLHRAAPGGAAEFPNALGKFRQGGLDGGNPDAIAVLNGIAATHTRRAFDAAVARLTRYEQYEYLGASSGTCVACTKPVAIAACACDAVAYCGQDCQVAHWYTGHKNTCNISK